MTDCECDKCGEQCKCDPWTIPIGDKWYNYRRYDYAKCMYAKLYHFDGPIMNANEKISRMIEISRDFSFIEAIQPSSGAQPGFFN